jgi:hypothetical protein
MVKREPDQKLYDAMLIRAYRRFMVGHVFSRWVFDTFGMWPNQLPLKRCKKFYREMGVRAFVGVFLRPLADRLIDSDPSKDIETLHLLQGTWSNLDCEDRQDRDHKRVACEAKYKDKRVQAVRDYMHAKYDAFAPNRKPVNMIKVPKGR